MNTVRMKLADLKRPEKNVRIHSDRQIDEYIRSIRMFGQLRPMVVDETNTILAGNGLLDALLKMGETEADCYVVSNLSPAQKKKLMLVDNRIFQLGADSTDAFEEIVKELGGDLDIPGWDEDLLSMVNAAAAEVDAAIMDYGTFTDDAVQNMNRRAEAPPQQPQAVPQASQTPQVHNPDWETPVQHQDAPESPQNSNTRVITCPHCGKQIFLGV